MNKETVAIYIRLSVEDEDKADESESIKNQRLILTDYADRKGWSIFKVYCDEDFSGLDNERPEFNKMLEDAKKGLFNIILCKSQSRFTRDVEVAEKYINRLFFIWNIRFISLTDNIDSFNKGGKKARQINSLINEWYCEDLSESVNAVFYNKMKRGEFIGSFAPYGYKKKIEDKNKLEIDENTANIVKEIFSLYIQGNGFRKIADILTKRGVMTPTQYKLLNGEKFYNPNYMKNGGEIWSASTIRNILKNPVYIGDMLQGKTKKVSYKSKRVEITKNEDRIKVSNTHEKIIDEETFKRVAEIMQSLPMGECKSGIRAVLSGKIRCGECGCCFQRGSLNRARSGFYYRCSLKYKSKGEKCDNSGILNDDIEEEIFNKIKLMKNNYIGLNEAIETEDYSDEIVKSEEKLEIYNKKLFNLYENFTNALLEKDEFLLIKKRLSIEKFNIEKRLNELKQRENKNKIVFDKLMNEKSLPFYLAQSFIDEIIINKPLKDDTREILIRWNI